MAPQTRRKQGEALAEIGEELIFHIERSTVYRALVRAQSDEPVVGPRSPSHDDYRSTR